MGVQRSTRALRVAPPLLSEFVLAARLPASEATSLDKLPASLVRRVNWTGWACLCGLF